ncbi:MAG: DUF2141 domain-containing protein [Gammaproteobacteria bacterium]
MTVRCARPLLALLLAAAAAAGAADSDLLELFDELADGSSSHGVTLHVDGVRNDRGRIIVIVFDNAGAYAALDHSRAVGFAEVAAAPGRVVASFPHLYGGPYAVFAFHDANADYVFDADGGRPVEGFAYSGARDASAVPTFAQAAVVADGSVLSINYLR